MVLIGGQFLPCCIKSGMLTLVGFPPRYRGVRPRPLRRKGRSNPRFLKVGDPAQFNMSADDNALGWMGCGLLVGQMYVHSLQTEGLVSQRHRALFDWTRTRRPDSSMR